jgi:hypothetical protein
MKVFRRIGSARLDDFPRFPFAFALGKQARPGDWANALAHMLPFLLTGNVLPETNHKPPSRFFDMTILTSSA